jgi:hypothetical protein
MKKLKSVKAKRITAAAIALAFILVFVAAPYQLSANVCDDALEDCLIDAGIAGLISLLKGPLVAAAVVASYSVFCVNGYLFCKEYVIKK